MDDDPISQFFPGEEDVDLYGVLNITHEASADDIKKSYRRLALKFHPDKQHPSADKAEASTKFQQIGFAYTILSDSKRRKRYDDTGRTDEGLESLAGEDGWEAYFEAVFERVTKGVLDKMKKEYQGSSEEIEDLKGAYNQTKGSISEIMTHIPHSSHDDEPRFIVAITKLIEEKKLPRLTAWDSSTKDEKARIVRKKQAEKEAGEAEALARELGVWDEFYGSGKAGPRKGKGKGKADVADEEEEVSALQALILKKKQNAGGFLDSLAAKYAKADGGKKTSKKRGKKAEDVEESSERPAKRAKKDLTPPDIDDEEFEKIQKRMFGSKAESSASTKSGKLRKSSKRRNG